MSNVTVGKPSTSGAIWVADEGTTLPTDASTALNAAFVNVGYISEDGFNYATSRDNEDLKAWGGDTVLTTQTAYGEQAKFAMLESTNVNALTVYYGDDNVSGTLATGITITGNSTELPYKSYVIEMITSDGGLHRYVIPSGKVTETEDITYNDSDPVKLGVTISSRPDDSGNCHYEYIYQA